MRFFAFFLISLLYASIATSVSYAQYSTVVSFPIDRDNLAQYFFYDDPSVILGIGPAYLSKDFETGLKAPLKDENEVYDKGESERIKALQASYDFDRDVQNLYLTLGNCQTLYILESLGIISSSHPETTLLYYTLVGQFEYFIAREQQVFKRQMPLNAQPILNVGPIASGAYSYPSRHGTIIEFVRLLLSDLFPDNDLLWHAWADRSSDLALKLGVSYPSDIEAGKTLARALYNTHKNIPIIKDAFLDAEIELINYQPNFEELHNVIGEIKRPTSFP